MDNLMAELDRIMASMNVPGTLLFSKVAGSHSHNMSLPESDVDALGVYVADPRVLLGIEPPPETLTNATNDFTVHEVGKFGRLLMKGNPGIVEMLFTDRLRKVGSGRWDELVEYRHLFLSRRALEQYLGYVRSQMGRWERGVSVHTAGGKINFKFCYHFLRLLDDGIRIAEGGEPVVWRDGEDRDRLMAVRLGKVPVEDIRELAEARAAELETKAAAAELPEEGDRAFLGRWLWSVRQDSLRGEASWI